MVATLRGYDHALQHPAVLLDGLDRSRVVLVTRKEDALQAKPLAGNLKQPAVGSRWRSLAVGTPGPRRSQCAHQLVRVLESDSGGSIRDPRWWFRRMQTRTWTERGWRGDSR